MREARAKVFPCDNTQVFAASLLVDSGDTFEEGGMESGDG
jgi:hypothetical protein